MRGKTNFPGITWIAMLVLLLTGCAGHITNSDSTSPVQYRITTSSGLSTEAVSTLNSLEKLDEYPLYVMHYTGAYTFPQMGSNWMDKSGFGCSLFATLGTQSDMLFGRNFDWEYSPAMLLYTDPPDGYASASMVDLTFIGITPEESKNLTDIPLNQQTALLDAPSMPFDGMNEYGLAIGMAAVPDEYVDDSSYDSSCPTIGSIGVIRQVLDHARNVAEAVEIFKQYNIDFRGGPPIHYLLADRSGNATLIEFYKGEMILLPNENPWHLATNHLRCIAQGDGGCFRYSTISKRLTEVKGNLDSASAMKLLSDVQQDSSQWSAVYDMSNGDILVAINRTYQTSYAFHLTLVDQ
jgi:Acyl-coenzyme A:6-aminopenicillanic acid acyl-transferase